MRRYVLAYVTRTGEVGVFVATAPVTFTALARIIPGLAEAHVMTSVPVN